MKNIDKLVEAVTKKLENEGSVKIPLAPLYSGRMADREGARNYECLLQLDSKGKYTNVHEESYDNLIKSDLKADLLYIYDRIVPGTEIWDYKK